MSSVDSESMNDWCVWTKGARTQNCKWGRQWFWLGHVSGAFSPTHCDSILLHLQPLTDIQIHPFNWSPHHFFFPEILCLWHCSIPMDEMQWISFLFLVIASTQESLDNQNSWLREEYTKKHLHYMKIPEVQSSRTVLSCSSANNFVIQSNVRNLENGLRESQQTEMSIQVHLKSLWQPSHALFHPLSHQLHPAILKPGCPVPPAPRM